MPFVVDDAIFIFSSISSVAGQISSRGFSVSPQVDFDNYAIWYKIQELYQQEPNNEIVISLMSIRQAVNAGAFLAPGVTEIQAVEKYIQTVTSSVGRYWNDPFSASATRPLQGQDILYDIWVNPGKFRDRMIAALNILPKFGYWWEFDYLLSSGVPKAPGRYLEYVNAGLRLFYPVKFSPTSAASLESLSKAPEEVIQTEEKKSAWWLLALLIPFV